MPVNMEQNFSLKPITLLVLPTRYSTGRHECNMGVFERRVHFYL